ncbi:phytoene/squalene synthase family protein [Sphingobacterium spiritivorum]|uniref:phytoene/squalene synthase family protein n=1 Tax=Sphingobacterium spiritivorum TaxID=258 RepID=UPI003DA46434
MDNLKIFNELSRLCSKKVTQLYSTSFSSAISVLHADLHRPIYSIYGFVRLADEIVDSFHGYNKKSLLDDFKRDTFGAIQSGVSINPVLHSFQWVVNTYHIDHHYIHAFFESMYADLDKKVWKDQNELNAYIYGSAEVVGLMCLHIFCEGDQGLIKKLTPSAQALGAAFQKVNFMRDLREDTYDLGRRYFHDIQMDQFDKDTKIKIEQQITKDFEEAFDGLMQLPSKSRYGVLLAYRYYLCLFEKIKRLPPENILNKRIRVPDYQKLLLLLRISLGSRLATNLA